MSKRKLAIDRKKDIIDQSIKIALKHGYQNVTREQIVAGLGISLSLILYHFKSMAGLKKEIMRIAIEREIAPIIMQGLGVNDKQAISIDEKLKRKIMKTILT